MMSLATTLGLNENMSTYFLKAPSEYWALLGKRPQPYNDVDGEYDFIHAFFTDKNTLSDFADILLSKLADDGILWISWPKLSDSADTNSQISEQEVVNVYQSYGLTLQKSSDITDQWNGLKFTFTKTKSSLH